MRLGWYISGAGHLALLVLVLFGGLFARDRIPDVSVSDVSIISEAEFAALTAPQAAPDVVDDAPDIVAPEAEAAPETPAPDSVPETSAPDEVTPPDAPETVPETLPEPLPETVLIEDAPEIDTPETDIDGTSPLPDAAPQPAPRVAPVPAIAPPPDAEVAPDIVEDSVPEPDALPEPSEDQQPTAPEEASDRIVTEADETEEVAPATSARPRARPARPVQVAEPEEQPEAPTRDPTAEAVAAAVAEANGASDSPEGPPMTGGERDAFRIAVGQCWVVDPGARSAGVTVVVGFSLDRSGRVDGDVRRLSASGGDAATQNAAFESARRAILRCQRTGYDLPADKYGQWRDIEITFNPEGMQYR